MSYTFEQKFWIVWYVEISQEDHTVCVCLYHTINRAAFVCLSVCSLSPPRSFNRSSPNLVGVCRWTSELPLRGSFSKRSTARRVNGSLSLSTILYMCQPHSTQLQKATLLLLHLIRLKGTFCCIDGWWVYVGGSRNWLLDGSSMACLNNLIRTTCLLQFSLTAKINLENSAQYSWHFLSTN